MQQPGATVQCNSPVQRSVHQSVHQSWQQSGAPVWATGGATVLTAVGKTVCAPVVQQSGAAVCQWSGAAVGCNSLWKSQAKRSMQPSVQPLVVVVNCSSLCNCLCISWLHALCFSRRNGLHNGLRISTPAFPSQSRSYQPDTPVCC